MAGFVEPSSYLSSHLWATRKNSAERGAKIDAANSSVALLK